ncbi:hypothetical protein GW17_00019930, partial [Ensete ventricosum]
MYRLVPGTVLYRDNLSMPVRTAFVAGARDLSFDAYGYGMVFIANDLFTIGLGWLLFGGLPFDVVSPISFPFCSVFFSLSQLIKFQPVFSPVEYYRSSSWFRGLWFLCILQNQGEVAFHQLNLVNTKPLMAPIQMDSRRSNEIHITAAR